MKRARHALAFILCLTFLGTATGALAEDAAVTRRLQTHGGMAKSAAKRLSAKVSKRLQKAADTLASATDPVRVAMSEAMFHSSVPPDNMAAAKMRLKLYAGLNESTLEALFTPKPGAISSCARTLGSTQAECEALVAAAGQQSVEDARSVASGPPIVAAPAPMAARPQPAPAQGGSRFGSYNSGFAAKPSYNAAPAAQPATTRFGAAPAARPATAQFGAPPPAAAPNSGMSQKAAYQAQREAYLARQKAQFDERKARLDAASAPAPAAVASAAPAPKAPSKAAAAAPAQAAAPEEEAAAEEPVATNNAPALDGDFLDGLLADPLGK